MKTSRLISMLASGPVAADTRLPTRRLASAIAAGAALALAAMLLALGPRPDLAAAAAEPMFWLKVAFPAGLAISAFAATERLARPGDSARGAAWVLATLVAAVWSMGIVALAVAPPGQRLGLIEGSSAAACVGSIVALAVPSFVAMMWSLRSLAPTRPRTAGAAAGLAAGAVAAFVYAVHCDEVAVPFLGVWYVLGMALPAGAGAMLGTRLLRWV